MLVHTLMTARAERPPQLRNAPRARVFAPAEPADGPLAVAHGRVRLAFAVGVPLGIALGRFVWSAYAEHLGVATDSFLPYPPIGWRSPGIVVIALVAALPPSWTVTHANVADALQPTAE